MLALPTRPPFRLLPPLLPTLVQMVTEAYQICRDKDGGTIRVQVIAGRLYVTNGAPGWERSTRADPARPRRQRSSGLVPGASSRQ